MKYGIVVATDRTLLRRLSAERGTGAGSDTIEEKDRGRYAVGVSSEETSTAVEPPLICWPLDHYYSPIADTRALSREPARSRVWPEEAPATPGIDWRVDEQAALVRDHLGRRE